ncbi:hypothetical protein AAEP80_18250 [Curtobacterium sp. L3-7]|uniref:hypothetical protein n=1 Tax=Curtobacterium sp. L3-7 TaxID=3138787 RepID=UPI003B51BD25
MAQVVVFALRASLDAHRAALSDAIHGAIMKALDYPPEKRFQRFIGLDPADFVHPEDRGGSGPSRTSSSAAEATQRAASRWRVGN